MAWPYANRGELEADIAAWIDRSDIVTQIPGLIYNAHLSFDRTLMVQDRVRRVVGDASSKYAAIPADCHELIRVSIDDVDLDVLPPFDVGDIRARYAAVGFTGTPKFYAVVGRSLEFVPTPGGIVTLALTYFQTIPPLPETGSTNWLLAKHPDLYLYGALAQSAPFLKNDSRIPTWASLLEGAVQQVVLADKKLKRGHAPVKSRPGMRFG